MPEDPLIAISNRLPISQSGDRWQLSAGGLVTALKPVMEKRTGVWVGWDGGASGVPNRIEGLKIDLGPVSLTRSALQAYYHGFSNRTIWPLFHDLIQPPTFDRSWWRVYQDVNERFADAAALGVRRHAGGGLAWVHDYHLMLVPQMLRKRIGTRAPISFFLHIPFPPPELFGRLPWRKDLLRGMLGADVVAFHTDRYRKNFVRACSRLLSEVKVRGRRITLPDGRSVLTSAHPISIDPTDFTGVAQSEEAAQILASSKEQFAGRQVVLGVDRLDYTKGILERLAAFEILLERRPDLRNEVTLVQVAVPSRGSVREYKELRATIEQVVGRINGRFTEPGCDVPVHYIHRSISRTRLVAYYILADVMLVTPLKDGMNLVAKEYVVSQGAAGAAGALVLSEFTGASLELTQAIACNPFDAEGLSYKIEQALSMPRDERSQRMAQMARQVRNNDVHKWVGRQLEEIAELKAGALV